MKLLGVLGGFLSMVVWYNVTLAEDVPVYHISPEDDFSVMCLPDGMSRDGWTVVGRVRMDGKWQAFKWNPNLSPKFKILGPGEGKTVISSRSWDTNEDGSIIVGECSWQNAQHTYPMVWINETPTHYDESFGSAAKAISDDGTKIVLYDTFLHAGFNKYVPYVWEFSTTAPRKEQGVIYPEYVPLGVWDPPNVSFPPASLTGAYPNDISGDGTVVVGFSETSTADNAVKWTLTNPGQGDPNWDVESLQEYPDSETSQAVGVSEDGKVIAGNNNFLVTLNNVEDYYWLGYKWSADGLTLLYPLEGHDYSMALDISGDGTTVVGRSGFYNGETQAVYWDEMGVHRKEELLDHYNINYMSWTFSEISAVNYDGSAMAGRGSSEILGNDLGWHIYEMYHDGYGYSAPIGGHWFESNQMGIFWRAGKSHVWHNQHGWQKLLKGTFEIMLFDYGTDSWMWTDETKYPYMYRYGTNPGWIYYEEGGTPGKRVFYHVSQQKWMTETELKEG